MRLIFIDEAGLSRANDEPFLVVAGIIVDADTKLHAVENHLRKLTLKHIPARHRSGFVFHAHELFNGRGKVFTRFHDDQTGPPEWPLTRRLEVAEDLGATMRRFGLPLAIGFVAKATLDESFPLPPDRRDDPRARLALTHAVAFMQCEMLAEHWMRAEAAHEVAMMIVEDKVDMRSIIRNAQSYHQDPEIVNRIGDTAKRDFPFRKLKGDPMFQTKRPNSVLALADYCAYVFKRYLMDQDDPHYTRFFELISPSLVAFEDLDRIKYRGPPLSSSPRSGRRVKR